MTLNSQTVRVDYTLDDPSVGPKVIGLVLLSTDLTLERDIERIIPRDQIATYITRLSYDNPMTIENLSAMEDGLVKAAKDILPGASLDSLAYACTSGSIAIGPDAVFKRLAEGQPGVPATTPITAAMDGFNLLGVSKVALLTPYPNDINQPILKFVEDNGVGVVAMSTFNMESDIDVARIPLSAILEAADEADHPDADALFLSCTALRSAECIETLEDRLGKPVMSSNQAMLWRAMRMAGYEGKISGYGKLMQN